MFLRSLSSGVLLSWLTACAGTSSAGAGASPEGLTTGKPAPSESARSEPTRSESARSEPPPTGQAPRKTTPADADPEQGGRAGGIRLVLPRLDPFVSAPLPLERPERYASFREVSRIRVGKGQLHKVGLLADERSLFVVSDDEATVRVYDRGTKRLVGNHPVPGFEKWTTGGVVPWPEGDSVFLAGGAAGLFVFDGRSGAQLAQLDSRPVRELRWSPDRRVLMAEATTTEPTEPSTLRFFERGAGTTLRELGTLSLPERVDGWDLSADNRLLALTYYPSSDLVVLDLHAGAELLRIPGPTYTGDVAFSPDGRWLAAGGDGLLLVDLLEPARRGFYAYLHNNIGHVRFSPSGDALVASSYDGHLRIFQWSMPPNGGGALELSLQKVLRHAGRANVYEFEFESDGNGLVSASGDQTVRTFRASRSAQSPQADEPGTNAPPGRTFLPLSEWKARDPAAAKPLPRPDDVTPQERARSEGPRASRIQPGEYACKITTVYRLRECWVRKDARGHTVLTFAPDNLLALEGILYDDGPVVRFEGWLTEPSTVVGCRGCEKQPLHAVFRGGGRNWQGLLTFQNYYAPHAPPTPPPADVRIEEANDRYPLVLELRRAYPEGAPDDGGPDDVVTP